jgi:hypothetical protein
MLRHRRGRRQSLGRLVWRGDAAMGPSARAHPLAAESVRRKRLLVCDVLHLPRRPERPAGCVDVCCCSCLRRRSTWRYTWRCMLRGALLGARGLQGARSAVAWEEEGRGGSPRSTDGKGVGELVARAGRGAGAVGPVVCPDSADAVKRA